MSSHRSNEKIFDLIISDALADVWDTELAKIDNSEKIVSHKFSDEFDRKIMKIKNSIGRKDQIRNMFIISIRLLVTTAAFMGVVFGGLLTQPAVYAAVKNVIITVFDKYDRFEYSGEDLTIDNFNSNIRLGYVPEGYYLSFGNYSPVYVMLTYTNENEEILFDYSIADGSNAIYDNEHSVYSSFSSNGIEYHYYESKDDDFPNIIVWYDNGYAFSISAHLSCEELVNIAENVE